MDRFKELLVYKKAYALAMDIFEISKQFPKEERYSLTDQIRRCSRAVCSNIAEAYRKRKYPAHFASKISDSDAENAELGVWIDFSKDCNYIDHVKYQLLLTQKKEVGSLLGYILKNPSKYL